MVNSGKHFSEKLGEYGRNFGFKNDSDFFLEDKENGRYFCFKIGKNFNLEG